jgi:protein-S-isoprenylcysteine O-methyltransferase Ste14
VSVAQWLARWRVRLGYPLAIVVLWLARPIPRSIVLGALLGAVGLFLRAWAAGHLHKQQVLTASGPYAYTRNPLYLGSAILALGIAVAARSWVAAAILLGYFAAVYGVVMRREEQELRLHHGTAFDEYARAVPLFLPRLTAAKFALANTGSFSFAQYQKNREYRAAIGFLLLLMVLVVIWRLRLP